MSEEYDPTFITITDEDGLEHVLEYIDTIEYQNNVYRVFFPAETEDDTDEASEQQDTGLIILKVIEENGEELLSTPDSDEEAEAVFELFMEELDDEDDI